MQSSVLNSKSEVLHRYNFVLIALIIILTLWTLRNGGGEEVMVVGPHIFVVFSYLQIFCTQWHLCKFLILGDLFTFLTHLFGLVFPCPISRKMRVRVHWTQRTLSLSSIKVGCFKTLFSKDS